MEDNFSVSYLSQFVISSHKKIGSQLSLMGYNHYESYIIVFVIDFGGFGGGSYFDFIITYITLWSNFCSF